MKPNLLLLLVLVTILFAEFSYADQAKPADLKQNIAQVELLFSADPESLPYQDVVELSQAVIRNRELYNANTLAKIFSLLADTALNKGDLAKALQFFLRR